MPFKDAEEKRAWFRAYRKRKHAERAEIEKERKVKWYQREIEARRKKSQKANRKAGHKPRKKGPKAKEEVFVSASKRYRWINDTLYFTSKRGFTVKEVREILRLVTQKA